MHFYFECFNTVQIAHACLPRLFQCGRVYLDFTYNDTYICYMYSPHLISIIKCHHRYSQLQCPNHHFAISAAVRFGRNFVANGFNSFFFSSLFVVAMQWIKCNLHSAIPMDKVVKLVDQLTSFQCVIEELEWCCLCCYTDGLQCLSSNVLNFPLPL